MTEILRLEIQGGKGSASQVAEDGHNSILVSPHFNKNDLRSWVELALGSPCTSKAGLLSWGVCTGFGDPETLEAVCKTACEHINSILGRVVNFCQSWYGGPQCPSQRAMPVFEVTSWFKMARVLAEQLSVLQVGSRRKAGWGSGAK